MFTTHKSHFYVPENTLKHAKVLKIKAQALSYNGRNFTVVYSVPCVWLGCD